MPLNNPTTFLLVEDDPNDIFFVQREFEQAPGNLRLRAVSDGQEAIHYLLGEVPYADREMYPVPNVILLDLKMPRISGFEFLEWLHSKSPGKLNLIPVVVMSSSGLPEDVERAYSLGANSYLIKPVDWEKFRERVRALGIYWTEHVEKPEVSRYRWAGPSETHGL